MLKIMQKNQKIVTSDVDCGKMFAFCKHFFVILQYCDIII